MSALNVWITPHDAIVAVDTDASREDGSRFATGKLLALPWLSAVIASRGQLAVLQFAFVRICSTGFDSFDDLVDAMPVLLADIAVTMPAQLLAEVQGVRRGDHLALVGFSHRHRRMVGVQWIKVDDMPGYQQSDFDELVAPWHPSMPDIPKTASNVDAISRAQVRWMRATFPNAACGGKLLVASLNHAGVSITHRLTFPMELAYAC